MAQNPFESTESIESTKSESSDIERCYLILISASKDNAAMAQKLLRNIQQHVDKSASPLWIDSKGIGVFVSTRLVASGIWKAAFQSDKTGQFEESRDFLIVQLGEDWATRRDAKTEHWLATHLSGRPAPDRSPFQRR